jgi:hypothetical protein
MCLPIQCRLISDLKVLQALFMVWYRFKHTLHWITFYFCIVPEYSYVSSIIFNSYFMQLRTTFHSFINFSTKFYFPLWIAVASKINKCSHSVTKESYFVQMIGSRFLTINLLTWPFSGYFFYWISSDLVSLQIVNWPYFYISTSFQNIVLVIYLLFSVPHLLILYHTAEELKETFLL